MRAEICPQILLPPFFFQLDCGEPPLALRMHWDHEPRSAGLRPGHIGLLNRPGLETGAPVHRDGLFTVIGPMLGAYVSGKPGEFRR